MMRIVVLIFALLLSCHAAFGCSCARRSEDERLKAIRNTQFVFRGRVVSVGEPHGEAIKNTKGGVIVERPLVNVKFEVLEAWKGVESESIVVESDADSSSCSLFFKAGQERLVFANGTPPRAGFCGQVQTDAGELTEILGKSKIFEGPPPQEASESFLSWLRQNVIVFFS